MPPAVRAPALLTILALALATVVARADWFPSGTSVGGGWPRYGPHVVSDDAGGAYVGWGSRLPQTWVERFTADGDRAPGWPTYFSPPHRSGASNDLTLIAPDHAGGIYVLSVIRGENCWAHCFGDPGRLWVQRFTAAGTPAAGWSALGLLAEERNLRWPYPEITIASEGKRGLIVAWSASRDSFRAQSISPEGLRRWGDDGLLVRRAGADSSAPALVGDGQGGVFAFWAGRTGAGQAAIIGQHVLETGELSWGAEGRIVSTPSGASAGFAPLSPVAVPDGAADGSGAIVCWPGKHGADVRLFATRVTRGGGLPWRDDVPVCSAPGDKSQLSVVAAPNGGVLVAWADSRRARDGDVYAQRLTLSGRTLWTDDGVHVGTISSGCYTLAIGSDGTGGAYCAWADYLRPDGVLFATRITGEGVRASGWPENGAVVCDNRVCWVDVVYMDGLRGGGAIMAWEDVRHMPPPNGVCGVEQCFAMRLDPTGPAVAATGASVAATPESPLPEAASVAGTPEAPASGPREVPAFGLTTSPRGAGVLLSLPDTEPATLELFDVAGRRLWSREVGSLGAGEHSVGVGDGARLPVGVYLARLVRGGRSATARIVVLR